MTKEELLTRDQSTVVVTLDGAQALANLWPKLSSSGPSIGWPKPADGGFREEVVRLLTDEEIETLELRDGTIFSKIVLTSDDLSCL